MDSVIAGLSMGKYAGFVWPAYGLACLGLIGVAVATWRGLNARTREFETMKTRARDAG